MNDLKQFLKDLQQFSFIWNFHDEKFVEFNLTSFGSLK